MDLQPGASLGPYKIVSSIGGGGMGEVWSARDPRLNRAVAIKTSNIGFSGRFQIEAQSIAALNHPNICTLYDVGPDYLVMEFIEGPTLADRMLQGPLTLDEALGIARQIADALEAGHEKTVIHRDLKPANIKLRPDGTVKVLDFGLAKAGAGTYNAAGDIPTLTIAGTGTGLIVGTPGYLSPEQARGQPADKRADIWAFGVVLYEMVTGKRAFEGATVTDYLAATLTKDPDLSLAPPKVRRVLARCLEKDPKKRLRDISVWSELLEEEKSVLSRASKLPWAVAAVSILALAAIGVWALSRPDRPETRLDLVTPPTTAPDGFALSPDGRMIAYVATGENGPQRIWIRSFESTTARPVPGTEGGLNPFWSPDGQSLGFWANSKLKRIDIGGSQPMDLADTSGSTVVQGTWSKEGVILFNPNANAPLVRIPAAGGPAMAAMKLGKGQTTLSSARFLPDGQRFLYASSGPDSALWLGSLAGGEARRIVSLAPGDSAAEYLTPGWLVRVRRNILVAERFDVSSGQLSGQPITLAQTVTFNSSGLSGPFSVSASGTLAWRSGGGLRKQLTWFDRAGGNLGTWGDADESMLGYPELSPDGKKVLISRGPSGSRDIWVHEGTRSSRLTFDPVDDLFAIWSPDGRSMAFASNRKGNYNLYMKASDGSGADELLLLSPGLNPPNSWSPDGRLLLFWSSRNEGDLMVLPLSGERKAYPFLSTPFTEAQGVFSPDGRWVAYQSNESGRFEIYVRPFPAAGGRWQVSNDGGISPRWRADGKELYFIAPNKKMMAATVTTAGRTFASAIPVPLFDTHIAAAPSRPQYDVSHDGRFLIDRELENTSEPIHLLMNWKQPKK